MFEEKSVGYVLYVFETRKEKSLDTFFRWVGSSYLLGRHVRFKRYAASVIHHQVIQANMTLMYTGVNMKCSSPSNHVIHQYFSSILGH